MRKKIINALHAGLRWIGRILEVRMPVRAIYGLRTR